jgi:DNA helicase-2/ATP-dependent DNA helicase PcrA
MRQFNENQKQVIAAPLAHLAINAAAGTGKTSTLAARIHHFQTEFQISPQAIIAISFSRTARSRLLDALKELCVVSKKGSPVPTYTFHGLAFRIIRIAAGLGETWLKPGFEVFDIKGNNPIYHRKHSLLRGIFSHLDHESAWIAFTAAIDCLRNGSEEMPPYPDPQCLDKTSILEVETTQNTYEQLKTSDIVTAWNRYNSLLTQYNVIDYSGLIAEATKILANEKSQTRNRIVGNLKVIVVDEYQDTSRAQEELLFELAGQDIPINVVGDKDQTIYTFNGSVSSGMENFLKRASQTRVNVLPSIGMVENYRSAKPILDLANRIRPNVTIERQLVPALCEQTNDLLEKQENPVKLVYTPKLKLAADFVANEIEKLLTQEKIDNIAVLVRKDSEYSPQALEVKLALERKGIEIQVSSKQSQQVRNEHLQFVYEYCQDPDNYSLLLEHILTKGFKKSLPTNITNEEFDALIQEAIDFGATYCYEAVDFLFDNITTEETPQTNISKKIHIGTVHSAKGEEFQIVFLLYLGDRSFPHGNKPNLDEERRLLYVGITRAKERLYVLGKPGIHTEDFLGNCKGDNTEYMEYIVPDGISASAETALLTEEVAASIEKARKLQQKKEEEERQKIWEMFEEEY